MNKNQFILSFWNYTDAGTLDEAQAAKDWKELGMNVAMSSNFCKGADKKILLRQLDEAHKQDIKVIVCDERVFWHNMDGGEESYIKDVEAAIEDFGGHPAFYAFCVGDEPNRKELDTAIRAIQIVNSQSKAFVNFLPMFDEPFVTDYELKNKHDYEDVLVDAVKRSGLETVCYDNYTQCYIHDREYGLELYFDNLRVYSNVARRCEVSFWTTLLSVGHWFYRVPSEDDIRWQISTAAAHGAKGLFWFFIYAREKIEDNYRNSPIDCFYKKTPMFDVISRQNNLFYKFFAQRLVNANLLKVYHYKRAYGGFPLYKDGDIDSLIFTSKYGKHFIISEFDSPSGKFIVIVNNMQDLNDSDNASGSFQGKPFSEWLAPGQMVIIDSKG